MKPSPRPGKLSAPGPCRDSTGQELAFCLLSSWFKAMIPSLMPLLGQVLCPCRGLRAGSQEGMAEERLSGSSAYPSRRRRHPRRGSRHCACRRYVPAEVAMHTQTKDMHDPGFAKLILPDKVDMDVYGAFQLCSIGILAAPVTVRLSSTYWNNSGRNIIFVWTSLILAGEYLASVACMACHR